MSRDKIEVRECDRCKTKVEARELDAFALWGSASVTGERLGRPIGFTNADLCPGCMDFIIDWFGQVMREADAARTAAPRPRPVRPSNKAIAAKLVADNMARSPDLEAYLAKLQDITSLDDLQDYQASNGLKLIEWLADPALSDQIKQAHYAAFERLETTAQNQEPA